MHGVLHVSMSPQPAVGFHASIAPYGSKLLKYAEECHLRGRHLDNRTECKNLGGGLDSDTYGESSPQQVHTSEYTPYRGRSCGEMSTPDVILAPSGPCTNSGTKRELLVQTAILNQEPDAALDCWR